MVSRMYVSVGPFLFSNAQVWTAPSIWRRLLMHAFCCEVVRARTKFGIAIATSRPIMATTIMISTSVKPDLLGTLIFILTLYFLLRGVNREQASYNNCNFVHVLPVITALLQ